MRTKGSGGKEERRGAFRRGAFLALMTGLLAYGLFRLGSYGLDLIRSRRSGEEMRAAYCSPSPPPSFQAAETPGPSGTDAPPGTARPEAAGAGSADKALPAAGTDAPSGTLLPLPYPDNPGLRVSDRFKALLEKNGDVVGWLSVDGLLEEAVVQRDHVYYMDHSVSGEKNPNGAIFMDILTDLGSRPYSLVLYGHNMKSRAMFGCLRNYENRSFYLKNPFVSFDSLYEEGEYVIFAVSRVSMKEGEAHFLDFFDLYGGREARQRAIDVLEEASVHPSAADAVPEDQLLVLVTCLDGDTERRVIAARRFRTGETRESLRARFSEGAKGP